MTWLSSRTRPSSDETSARDPAPPTPMRVTRAALAGAGGPAAAAGDLTPAKAVTPVSVCGRAAGPYRMCRPPSFAMRSSLGKSSELRHEVLIRQVLRASSRSPPSSEDLVSSTFTSPGSVRSVPSRAGPRRSDRARTVPPSREPRWGIGGTPTDLQREGTTAGENPAFSSLLTHDTADNACSLFLTLPRSPRHTGHTCHNTVLQPRS